MQTAIKKNEFVDYSKGFAILTIVIFHYLQALHWGGLFSKAIAFGGTGIHLFFFMSGFGLALKPPGKYFDFIKRRFTKILIPYYVFVTIAFLVGQFTPIYADLGLKYYLSHIFLYKMFYESYIGSYGYQLWFISTIVQFYLFFPLIYKLREKLSSTLFIILTVMLSLGFIVFLGAIGKGDLRSWNSLFIRYIWEFGLGMIIAKKGANFCFHCFSFTKILLAFIISFGLMSVLSLKGGQFGNITNDFPALIAYFAFTILVYKITSMPYFSWVHSTINYISTISYEFYLVHFLSFEIICLVLKSFNISYSIIVFPMALIAAIAFAKLFAISVGRIKIK